MGGRGPGRVGFAQRTMEMTCCVLGAVLWTLVLWQQDALALAMTVTSTGSAKGPPTHTLNNEFGIHALFARQSGYVRRNVRSASAPSKPASKSSSLPLTHKGNADSSASELLEFIEKVEESRNNHNYSRKLLPKSSYQFSEEANSRFMTQTGSAINVANTLNNLFLYSAKGKTDKARLYDEAYYISLARGVVESSPDILGCGIAFDRDQYEGRNFFCPYVYRHMGGMYVTDLSKSLIYANEALQVDWFLQQRRKDFSYVVDNKPVYYELDQKAKGNLSWRWNVSLTVQLKQGYWTKPYFDCRGRKNATTCNWLLTYSIPFLDWEGGQSVSFKGVVLIDIDLDDLDINQCATDKSMFSNTHRCRPETTTCEPTAGGGFRRGAYKCHCSAGFYIPGNNSLPYFNGSVIEEEYMKKLRNESNLYDHAFNCLPCKQGCKECTDFKPCFVEFNILIRGIPLGIQSFCITITIVLGFVVLRLRKTKVMVASMWSMLEIMLVGALLLYSTVVIQYFEPTSMTCLLIPWFREMGFAVLYGALILKLYRLLSEFQSRKAHRVHVRDKDLLKYLLCIVLVITGYMAAWTALNLDHVPFDEGGALLDIEQTQDGLKYSVCKSLWWDYVIEVIEFFFLCFGIYLCYCTRSAPSDYGEGRYISAAIYNETVISTVLHIVRHFLWESLHPDYIFLMYFLRCQLTVTIALILVLGPKLWFAHRPPDDEHFRNRAYSTSDVHDNVSPEAMKLNVAISSNGDVDVGEINLAEMDPEDIRAELKRLYTQLQIYKTKTMRKDNPHISKRRGGRKPTHRRFSLQAFHHKHRHHHDHDHEHELSKTPEESTNSAEVNIPMEATSRSDEHGHEGREGRSIPTVTFKTGHK